MFNQTKNGFLFISCILLFSFCQSKPRSASFAPATKPDKADDKQTLYTFKEKTTVYKELSLTSEGIAILEPGNPVELVRKADSLVTLNGYTENWYRVILPGKNLEGYIYGGDLGVAVLARDVSDPSVGLFIVGVNEYKPNDGYSASVSLIIRNKIISSCNFFISDHPWSDSVKGPVRNNIVLDRYSTEGFAGPRDLLRVGNSYGVSEVPATSYLFYTNGDVVKFALEADELTVGNIQYRCQLIFPSDENGEQDKIKRACYEEDDNNGGTVKKTKQEIYRWINGSIVLSK
ncbi:MAG: hypothetical protein JWO44_1120 [Bacteroidetes bacterium]|nr:hypothetical protein [Bacteroidota bacterium]